MVVWSQSDNIEVVRWQLGHIRSFKAKVNQLQIIAGSRSSTGAGTFVFGTPASVLITHTLETVIDMVAKQKTSGGNAIQQQKKAVPPPPLLHPYNSRREQTLVRGRTDTDECVPNFTDVPGKRGPDKPTSPLVSNSSYSLLSYDDNNTKKAPNRSLSTKLPGADYSVLNESHTSSGIYTENYNKLTMRASKSMTLPLKQDYHYVDTTPTLVVDRTAILGEFRHLNTASTTAAGNIPSQGGDIYSTIDDDQYSFLNPVDPPTGYSGDLYNSLNYKESPTEGRPRNVDRNSLSTGDYDVLTDSPVTRRHSAYDSLERGQKVKPQVRKISDYNKMSFPQSKMDSPTSDPYSKLQMLHTADEGDYNVLHQVPHPHEAISSDNNSLAISKSPLSSPKFSPKIGRKPYSQLDHCQDKGLATTIRDDYDEIQTLPVIDNIQVIQVKPQVSPKTNRREKKDDFRPAVPPRSNVAKTEDQTVHLDYDEVVVYDDDSPHIVRRCYDEVAPDEPSSPQTETVKPLPKPRSNGDYSKMIRGNQPGRMPPDEGDYNVLQTAHMGTADKGGGIYNTLNHSTSDSSVVINTNSRLFDEDYSLAGDIIVHPRDDVPKTSKKTASSSPNLSHDRHVTPPAIKPKPKPKSRSGILH
jgi:hypothetical protein